MSEQLDMYMKNLNSKAKNKIASYGVKEFEYDRIPFSSPKLNYMTYGGIPLGFLVEFSGLESSGKTTTALDIIANAQKKFEAEGVDKDVVLVDVENTFDSVWAATLGVDVEKLAVISPQEESAEELFDIIIDLIELKTTGLIVVDSLAMMVSDNALEESITKKHYGGISGPLTEFSKKATYACKKYKCTCICINQMRDNMNSMYGGLSTPGGRCWRHACIMRLMFQKGKFIDEKGNETNNGESNPFGNIVNVSIEKTKCCAPNRRTGHYTLRYNSGIDKVADLIDMLILYGVIVQSGAWFTVLDTDTGEILKYNDTDLKFQGRPKLSAFIKDNEELYNTLNEKLNSFN